MSKNKVEIMASGSCKSGAGSYTTIVKKQSIEEKELSDKYDDVTNNQMELMSVIAGLESLTEPASVLVTTASKYVVDAFNENWIENWINNGWKSKSGAVKNRDLWERLLKAMEPHDVTFEYKAASENKKKASSVKDNASVKNNTSDKDIETVKVEKTAINTTSTSKIGQDDTNTGKASQDTINTVKEGMKDGRPFPKAYVDGSFKDGKYSYGVIFMESEDSEVAIFSAYDTDEEIVKQNNISGEVWGSMTAISYAKELGAKQLTVYYDYLGIGKWADKEWKRNNFLTQGYSKFCDEARKSMTITFEKVHGHDNVLLNEIADGLAKLEVGMEHENKEYRRLCEELAKEKKDFRINMRDFL